MPNSITAEDFISSINSINLPFLKNADGQILLSLLNESYICIQKELSLFKNTEVFTTNLILNNSPQTVFTLSDSFLTILSIFKNGKKVELVSPSYFFNCKNDDKDIAIADQSTNTIKISFIEKDQEIEINYSYFKEIDDVKNVIAIPRNFISLLRLNYLYRVYLHFAKNRDDRLERDSLFNQYAILLKSNKRAIAITPYGGGGLNVSMD